MVRFLERFRLAPKGKDHRQETNRVCREEICKEIMEARRVAEEHSKKRDEFDERQLEIEARLNAVKHRTALIRQRRSE